MDSWCEKEFQSILQELRDVRERMLSMAEEWGRKTRLTPKPPTKVQPDADVYETPEEVVVLVDLPGVEKQDINIEIMEDRLEITAERKRDKACEKAKILASEIVYGRFNKYIFLPKGVNASRTKAVYENGVLRISLQRGPVPKGVKINIE